MGGSSFFFAGGGTGGHIYPAVAVAEQLVKIQPEAEIHFFCSSREIDERILGQTDFKYTKLNAEGFSIRPGQLINFCSSFIKSYKIAKQIIRGRGSAVVVGAGGFVSAPVCFAAHGLKVPVVLLNVDIVPGRANKINARWADEVFLQFEETSGYFVRRGLRVDVVGCPLRGGFEKARPEKVVEQLKLDEGKQTLLITGASSGSQNINAAVCSLLEKLDAFADDWQIVHLAGLANVEKVRGEYKNARIKNMVLGYFDDMASLLSAADLVIGRSGAVSVAEYAAAGVPSICMPYPYHKDKHQYLNAGKLVEAGTAIIVDDLPDEKERADWLWEELEELMTNEHKLQEMKNNCSTISKKDAGLKIAQKLVEVRQ